MRAGFSFCDRILGSPVTSSEEQRADPQHAGGPAEHTAAGGHQAEKKEAQEKVRTSQFQRGKLCPRLFI